MATQEEKQKFDLYLLWRVLALAKPYKWIAILAVSLAVLLAPLSIARPRLIQKMVDDYIFAGDTGGLTFWALVIAGLLVLEALCRYAFVYSSNWLGQSVIRDLRVRVFKPHQQPAPQLLRQDAHRHVDHADDQRYPVDQQHLRRGGDHDPGRLNVHLRRARRHAHHQLAAHADLPDDDALPDAGQLHLQGSREEIVPAGAHPDPEDERLPAGAHHGDADRADLQRRETPRRGNSPTSTPTTARPTSTPSFTTPSFSPPSTSSPRPVWP